MGVVVVTSGSSPSAYIRGLIRRIDRGDPNAILIVVIVLKINRVEAIDEMDKLCKFHKNKSCWNDSHAPSKALFPETVTLNLLLGSDDPDYCNLKMVSSWPPCIQSKEKRDVCKTCMPL